MDAITEFKKDPLSRRVAERLLYSMSPGLSVRSGHAGAGPDLELDASGLPPEIRAARIRLLPQSHKIVLECELREGHEPFHALAYVCPSEGPGDLVDWAGQPEEGYFYLLQAEAEKGQRVLLVELGQFDALEPANAATAAQALRRFGAERALAPLLQALNHVDRDVCRAAAWALGEIASDSALDALIQALGESDDAGVRGEAAGALGKIGTDTAVDALITALHNAQERGAVRASAARALAEADPERAVDALLQVLDDPSKSVRAEAAKALGKIGAERAHDPLAAAREDPEEEVRRAAGRALERIRVSRALRRLSEDLFRHETDRPLKDFFDLKRTKLVVGHQRQSGQGGQH